jgi:hypothetical protein
MPGVGPITNTRTLVGAIAEMIGKLEAVEQNPTIDRLLERCRHYLGVVTGWASSSPPPDEQFETIGHIMQLLSAAMNATLQHREPAIHIRSELQPDLDELMDVSAHDALELPRRSTFSSHVLALYLVPWRDLGAGLSVKVIRQTAKSRCIALARLHQGAVLPGHKHRSEEHILVLDGCIRHGEVELYAGTCVRSDKGSESGDLEAVGEVTLLFMGSDRECLLR